MSTSALVQDQLDREEAIIEGNLESFVAVGEALIRIKTNRLWAISHSTFEEYVTKRWGRSIRWARQLISGTLFLEKLDNSGCEAEPGCRLTPQTNDSPGKMGKETLRTSRHVRAIMSVPVEQREKVLKNAVAKHGKKLSARTLEREVAMVRLPPAKRDPIPDGEDGVTGHVREAFEQIKRFRACLIKLSQLMQDIEDLSVSSVGAFLLHQMSHVNGSADTIKRALKFCAPYADCVLCTQLGCKVCRQTGWLPKLIWDNVPAENQVRSFIRTSKVASTTIEEDGQ